MQLGLPVGATFCFMSCDCSLKSKVQSVKLQNSAAKISKKCSILTTRSNYTHVMVYDLWQQ